MFKKDDRKPTSAPQRASAPRSPSSEQAISIIGPGMRIQGDLLTDGTVRIEGTVEGTIRAGKAVVLGVEGEVIGDIFTQDAVIGGRITGTVTAESRLELQSSCVVDGEIRTRAEHLQLDEGARFNGQIQMADASEPRRAMPGEPSPTPAQPAAAEGDRDRTPA